MVTREKYRSGCITDSLIGTAVGDAIGLTYEGMSPGRISRFGVPPLKHRLLFGHGMISDDTEHACMVVQTLISSRGEPRRFASHLAWRMRWWVAALPAGIGLGTLRAMIKLWLGFPAKYSGVFTAGNGPMMRSGVIGVYCGEDIEQMKSLVSVSTRITHTDPKAEKAAFIVAWAASLASRSIKLSQQHLLDELPRHIDVDDELATLLQQVIKSVESGETAMDFCKNNNMQKGVSGYCYATLKVVLQVCMRHADNFQQAMTEIVLCGGDTDTVAAITGSIISAHVGRDEIPKKWLDGIAEWPRSLTWITHLGASLEQTLNLHDFKAVSPVVIYPFALIRNLFFIPLVLFHGFRRLLPPY